MKKILFSLSLLALLCVPGMAAADSPAQGCNDLSFLGAAPVTPADQALELNPLAGVVEAQSNCCVTRQRQCQRNCACGVFEFNCDPATCQSSCICNIC